MATFKQLISKRKPAIAFFGVAAPSLSGQGWTDAAIVYFRKLLLPEYRIRPEAKSLAIFKSLVLKYGVDSDTSIKIKELCRSTNSSYACICYRPNSDQTFSQIKPVRILG